MGKTNVKLAPLPLLDAVNAEKSGFMVEPILFRPENFDYIFQNLKHRLRGYQTDAIQNFHYARNYKKWDWNFNPDMVQNTDFLNLKRFMFWMATGSGKTDVMAALILYLYRTEGYQNFVFTTTLTSVLEKTRDNLLNPESDKYLFQQSVWIDGKKVTIRKVKTVPENPEPNTINILVVNIQKINNALKPENIRESFGEIQLSETDFKDKKFVLLVDEAHHFNAETKGNGGAFERSLNRIMALGKDTLQLEFTATLNGMDGVSQLYEKYKNRIVYRFDLGVFSRQGYSKQITQISANSSDELKMMQAVFMGIARELVAEKMGILDFKSVALFKSTTKTRNKAVHKIFSKLISGLNVQDVVVFREQITGILSNVTIAATAMEIINQVTPDTLLKIIQSRYNETNVGNVNDENSDFIPWLNSLESPDSPYRIVFAVEKLTEGWDVLNLYDIVRMDEPKARATKDATNREAQLVGRGARYNPLTFSSGKTSSKRMFDNESETKKLLERLLFHTIREDKYIENLKNSYSDMGLNVAIDEDLTVPFSASIKTMFKKMPIWNSGVVFENSVRPTTDDDYQSLADYKISTSFKYDLSTNAVGTLLFDEFDNSNVGSSEKIVQIITKPALEAAMRRLPFYRFENLRRYVPKLKSLNQFIDEFLSDVVTDVVVDKSQQARLTKTQILQIATEYMNYVMVGLKRNYLREVGTNKFHPVQINEKFTDYTRNLPKPRRISDPVYSRKARKGTWFLFDYSIGDQKEQALVDLIEQSVEDIQRVIGPKNNFVLIRNDEIAHRLKLVQFDGIGTYMPDYVFAVFGESNYTVQLYLEPKGENLVEQDRWKENLLLQLESDAVIEGYAGEARLIGLPFFNNSNKSSYVSEVIAALERVFSK